MPGDSGHSGRPPSDTAEAVRLDPSLIAGLRELGSADFRDLVQLFLDDGALRVAALRAAEGAGDVDAMARVAHSLKGSAATFGATALADCCRQLQALASSGDVSGAASLVDSVDAGFARAGDALRDELSIT